MAYGGHTVLRYISVRGIAKSEAGGCADVVPNEADGSARKGVLVIVQTGYKE